MTVNGSDSEQVIADGTGGGKPAGPKKTRRALSVLSSVLVFTIAILLVITSAIFAFSNDPKKSYFGYRFYNVLTASMTPSADSPPGGFNACSMIFVKLIDPADVQVGDIVTFATDTGGSNYLTHRVREIKTEMDGEDGLWFITRGDANSADDPPIPSDRLIGKKVFSIPKLGGILQLMRENPIMTIIFFVAAFGFVILLRSVLSKPKTGRMPG
ncbi:MAG: signal peptidase I [Clostridiales Family XIII bacterium]|jgi:signal peptidase I|nr:signal peptidase I [Clostridiales Family XIII bacterium]